MYQASNKKEDRSHSFNIGAKVQHFTVKQGKERHVVVFKNVILSEHIIVMSICAPGSIIFKFTERKLRII